MELIVIDNEQDLDQLCVYLKDKEFVSFDCETNGVHKGAEIIGFSVCAEEHVAYYVILGKWNSTTNSMDYAGLSNISADLIADLKSKKLIMHNAVFDCMMVESFFKIRLIDSVHSDTMALAHLLNENRRIGLKELASEYFGEDSKQEQTEMKDSVIKNGGKLTKAQYELYKADPRLLGKYGAKDALLTYKLFMQLVPELYDQGLDKFFYEEETMPLLRGPTYDMNSIGLAVDVKALISLKKTLEAECLEAKSFILQEILPYVQDKYPGTSRKNTFNFGSNQQLCWLLFGVLGLEFGSLTKKGKEVCKDQLGLKLPYTYGAKKVFIHECEQNTNLKFNSPFKYIQVDTKTLHILAPKYRWIAKLLEYKKNLKLLNTYVEGIEERLQYGIIHPSFLQTGTTSGRYSSRDPNFQNLPRDDKRIKSCIVPRPGRMFIGADYSQLEPRVFAYFSADKRLLSAFDGESDFYSVIGMEVFGKVDCTPQKEGSLEAFGIKYKKLRDLSKVIALASTYGATARQLSGTTGKSVEDTALDIENYFDSFPGVKDMMLRAHATAKKDGQVVNLFGRPRRMPEAKNINKLYGDIEHAELPYEARNILNLAVNHTIQSTAASIVNRSAIRFKELCKEAQIDCKIVLQVHDSLVVEGFDQDVDIIGLLLREAMENTVKLEGIELEAIPKVGKNLSVV